MSPTKANETDYFEGIASKLEDPDAYLEFLATKLDGASKPRREKSGVRPAVPAVPADAPRAELPER